MFRLFAQSVINFKRLVGCAAEKVKVFFAMIDLFLLSFIKAPALLESFLYIFISNEPKKSIKLFKTMK